MRIGVFGGTFDPPHLGHLGLASAAWMQLELDQVHWVLTPNPPHKQGRQITPLELRLELLQAALGDYAQFRLSRVDIDRPAPHFAADTMEILRQAEPQVAWIYLMGGDSLRDLPTWHSPQRFLAACSGLGVLRRPGAQIDLDALEAVLPGVQAKIQWVDAPQVELSASRIRQLISSGGSYRAYVAPAVYALIQQHQLYGSQTR
jgi:nicotinate-nucleotide adenylyltransferase